MNLDIKQLSSKVAPILKKVNKYRILIFILCLAFVFGFLLIKINSYAQIEPTEDAVAEKLTTVQRPKIDEKALERIKQLEDQNIEVQTIFKQARDNPFSE